MKKYDENGYLIEYENENQEYQSAWFFQLTYDVISDKELNEFEKLMFAAITGMSRKEGYCWASNAFFEKLFNKSPDRVIKAITKLVELNYVTRELIYKKRKLKEGKDIITKEICWRKLIPITDPRNRRGGIENNTGGGIENNTVIYNNIIDNPSIGISKDILNSASEAIEGEDILNNNINNSKYLGDPISPTAPSCEEVVKPKRKQGVNIAPYIDEIDIHFKEQPDIKKALTNYIICVNSCRAIWTMDEWQKLLSDLYQNCSIELPGASGRKLFSNRVLENISTAIKGNGKEPYMSFGDFKEMEPRFNLNQEFKDS